MTAVEQEMWVDEGQSGASYVSELSVMFPSNDKLHLSDGPANYSNLSQCSVNVLEVQNIDMVHRFPCYLYEAALNEDPSGPHGCT